MTVSIFPSYNSPFASHESLTVFSRHYAHDTKTSMARGLMKILLEALVSIQYAVKTMFLFTYADFKTLVIPVVCIFPELHRSGMYLNKINLSFCRQFFHASPLL
jgi:hypothetical protein